MAVLGYWNIRGLAQPIRLLLHYVQDEYEEKLYSVGPAPKYSRDDWLSVKHTLGLPFPNLPYFIDGNVKLTESKAILRYIGRKHNLVGTTPEEMATVDMLLDVCADLDSKASSVFYSPDFEKMKADLIKSSAAAIQALVSFAEGKNWFAGERITIADFFLYEYFQRMYRFHAPLVEKCGWIRNFMARLEGSSPIKKYMASKEFIHSPFNNPYASWTG